MNRQHFYLFCLVIGCFIYIDSFPTPITTNASSMASTNVSSLAQTNKTAPKNASSMPKPEPSGLYIWNYSTLGTGAYFSICLVSYLVTHFMLQQLEESWNLFEQTEKTAELMDDGMQTAEERTKDGDTNKESVIIVTLDSQYSTGSGSGSGSKKVKSEELANKTAREKIKRPKLFSEREQKTQEDMTTSIRGNVEADRVDTAFFNVASSQLPERPQSEDVTADRDSGTTQRTKSSSSRSRSSTPASSTSSTPTSGSSTSSTPGSSSSSQTGSDSSSRIGSVSSTSESRTSTLSQSVTTSSAPSTQSRGECTS